jgi:phospholipase C
VRLPARCLSLLLLCGTVFAQFPSQIKNVVVIVQENRTPDNLFHFLTPACPIPTDATGYNACIPSPMTNSCYDISPCGLSNQSGKVVAVTLKGMALAGSVDPDHSHADFVHMCDPDSTFKCQNDGAWQTAPNGASYTYVENPAVTNYDGSAGHLLDPYLTFAEQYGWANFMYQTNQGPSYPAHQFLFSGTSALTDSDDADSIFVSDNFPGTYEAGCLLPGSTPAKPIYNSLLEPANPSATCRFRFYNQSVQECRLENTVDANHVGTFCLTHKNIATTVLDPKAVSWKYYASAAGSIWTAPDAIQSICGPDLNASGRMICAGTEWAAKVDIANNGTDILRDIANCQLSKVSWVIPDGAWSDHAPNQAYGPSWVAAVVNAIGSNPTCAAGTPDAGQTFWEDTAIVIVWDDWGGWSDNQPAEIKPGLPCVFTTPVTPCPGDYQFGFRVPLMVVSAYTPQAYINNVPHDFGSILRMIEAINGVNEGFMGNADARSTSDLHEFFGLTTPRQYQTVPAVKDANFFLTYTGPPAPPDRD